MSVDAPEQAKHIREGEDRDTLDRFRDWRGFLLAAVLVNGLFLYGMVGAVQDPGSAPWVKSLSWLPFNLIASVLYVVFMVKLSRQGRFYVFLSAAMIAINWIVMFSAG